MKRLLAISVIVGFLCFFTDGAKAESNFFSVSKTLISETTDMSKKNTIELSATNADPNICSITFDFTDGNQTIVMVEGNECLVLYAFEDAELWSIVFFMMTQFKTIESQLPAGKVLQYKLHLSETEELFVTSEILSKNYSWIN